MADDLGPTALPGRLDGIEVVIAILGRQVFDT
jgi:hypothetical protein